MTRNSKLFLLLIVVGLFSFLSVPAHAAPAPVASFAINGTLSITGNNNCGGPCVETVEYSFTLDYFLITAANVPAPPTIQAGCYADLVNGLTQSCYQASSVGPVLASSSGPLAFFGDNGAGCCYFYNAYYLPLVNALIYPEADEIDLEIGNIVTYPSAGIPTPYAIDSVLYSCTSAACQADFGYPHYGSAEFAATRVPVPEPSTLILVALGILALGMFVAVFHKRSLVESAP
jgi:hypothetical protein